VAEAIAFVFNDTLVCDDAASAQAVTFARNVSVRSVTLDGDVHEPSGTMSDGTAPSRSSLLVQAQQQHAAEEHVESARRTSESLEREEAKGCAGRETRKMYTLHMVMPVMV
jgi:structural maintenance of chromosome 2